MTRATSQNAAWDQNQPSLGDTEKRYEAPGERNLMDLFIWAVGELAEEKSAYKALQKVLALLTTKMWFGHAGVYSNSGGREFYCEAQAQAATSASVGPISRGVRHYFRQAAETRKPVYYQAREAPSLAGKSPIQSLYVVPLVVHSRLYGVLSVHTDGGNTIDEAGRALINRFAPLAGLALERLEWERCARPGDPLIESVLTQETLGFVLADMDGNIQKANRALEQMLGFEAERLAGKKISVLIAADERKKFLEAARKVSDGGSHPGFPTLPYVRSSGETVLCSTFLVRVSLPEQERPLLLILVAERSAPKDAEKARDRLEYELLQAQKAQTFGILAGGVAHDFNNALEVIIGFASLARLRLHPGDPLHEPLKIIEDSAEGAALLARDLLEAAGGDESEGPQPLEVSEVVSSVARIVGRTFDRKIQVEHQIEAQNLRVNGFISRLEQAVLNLCLNARDAMPRGGRLSLEAAVETVPAGDPRLPQQLAAGRYARIVVRDTGTGMPPEVLKHVFEPLFTTKKSGRNAGLGLAMVQKVAQDAGGFVTVSSAPSEGTEFALYLPALDASEAYLPKAPPIQLKPGRGTVLVVDDEPRVLDFLEKGLTRLGYTVLCAESGKIACEVYAKEPQKVVCVLLDMIMPDMSGLETYARLRDINPQVKVILSSGYSSERIRREAVEAGGAGFLGKPYTLATLSQALDKFRQN